MSDDDLAMNDEELLNFRLPYKKSSRHKTANTTFITEIFRSEVFCQDYLGFLDKFHEILFDENRKRIKSFQIFW